MSLPPQVNKPAKHRPMKDPVHPAEVYYGLGPPALDHSDMNAGTSGAYTADKLPPNIGHYHQPQPGPVKWMHQDAPLQASGWAQEAPPLPGWGQSFAPSYMSGVNVRGFHKGVHEGLSMGAETQMQEVFRDNAQWEPMHQIQSYSHQPQQTMQPQTQAQTMQAQTMQTMQTQAQTMQTMQTQAQTMQTMQTQAQTMQSRTMQPQTLQPQTMQAPMLQPFQTFRQNKPQQAQFNPGFYQGFTQKPSTQMQSLGYGEQPKQQQQPSLLQQIQQQQQQIQLQQLQMQQHLQQQQQQQQRQMQTQYQQQPQPQHIQERHMQPMSHQPAQQDVQVTVAAPKLNFATFERQETNLEPPRPELTETEPRLEKAAGAAYEAVGAVESPPRRSRRLSREGQSPSTEQPQNGLTAAGPRAEGVTGGVIQSTRTRRRRASKEINLETLAQQAAKRESLPAKGKDDASSGRQSSMAPLVIPVSVPVPRAQQGAPGGQQPEGAWSSERPRTSERGAGQSLHKASVIVARRRSLRNSVNERTLQDGENDSGTDEDGKPRQKRRPRPEPLIIPPPRPSSFIPASVYSSITPYQSHLRSPVHPLDHPVMLPPYTPPPILSPVRAGSGLYFSTFLSNMAAAGTQAPPTITKSVSVSLLRLSSAESTPPVTIVADATPVSLEPRINIGPQYQAEIPELLSRGSSQQDQHRADLLWLPMEHLQHGAQDRVRDLMNMACSSVLSGGGTNQELVLHCLFQSRGDILQTLERLMLQDVLFPKGHPLCDYHYSGSDSWSPEEKRYFNKGISAYRKDFIMVQKLVQTKSVAQCVEFYYTYKKQVKVGRSGTLTFGPADLPPQSHEEVIDNKSSQQPRVDLNEAELNHQPEPPCEPSAESSHQARVAQSLQAHDYAVPAPEPEPVVSQPPLQTSAPPRPRSEPQAKKGKAPPKPPADPDQVFPCKKCGRVFYKVKSRSAHMKSHAEQEKKAAALRLKEQEDQLRTRTVPEPEPRPGPRRAEASDQGRARASGLYREQGSGAESSEADDAADEDWH